MREVRKENTADARRTHCCRRHLAGPQAVRLTAQHLADGSASSQGAGTKGYEEASGSTAGVRTSYEVYMTLDARAQSEISLS